MATQAPTTIPIRKAFELLKIGATKGYELVGNGELRTYLIGDRRFTTAEAVAELVAKREGEATAARSAESASDAKLEHRRSARRPSSVPETLDGPLAAKGALSTQSPASRQGRPGSRANKRGD